MIIDATGLSNSVYTAAASGVIRCSYHAGDSLVVLQTHADSVWSAILSGESVSRFEVSAAAVKAFYAVAKSELSSQSIVSGATLIKVTVGQAGVRSGAIVFDAVKILNGYGQSSSLVKSNAYHTDRDIRASMARYLPGMLQESTIIKTVQQSQVTELSRTDSLISQMINDFYWVLNASEQGITLWEQELHISPNKDQSLSSRRLKVVERLMAPKLMTKAEYEGIVNQFYDCTVEQDRANFKVSSTIWSKRGIPENIAEMEAAADEALPIYLDHEFVPTWLTWGEIEDYGLTGEEAETYKSGELSEIFLLPYSGIGGD
ncbi:hypothetical protein BK126_04390 [Paenibacillus sp. FSL H7-0326]|uniref:putative phage tail protein n=1 Tax=Paenibacillus sp. FSL H7-0326 TaxID=1921144 RepID=UPI00096D17D2|nr:putative phage tail protein [Paenibacillus sp. FSL H7-0326]OMC71341.1 hypothetical protein BK126_04390 [Paenibacillus sp. FSL H7-0326]